VKTHLTLAALAACALGGSLSAVHAAGPGETGAEGLTVPVMTYDSDLPRFQPSAEDFASDAAPVEMAVEAPEPAAEAIGGGEASWYGAQFAGRRTASGERFDPAQYTAAHRTLPFGSKIRVTNARSGKSVVVRINDRGPFTHKRVIDLSRAAAQELGIVATGRGQVQLAVLSS